jgi:hypothetical protein
MTKGLDFMLKGITPKDKTPEAGGEPPVSGVTTQESGEIIQVPLLTKDESDMQDSVVRTPDSGIGSQEAGIKLQEASILSQESRVRTQDSGTITPKTGDTIHDSGVGFPESGVVTRESGNLTQDSEVQPHETRPRSRGEKKKPRNGTRESGVVTDDIIDQAVAQALKSPKISLYSPLLLAVLESQQLMLLNRKEMTLLQYRKATKARELVENALKESYPDLCEKILKRINERNGKF